MLMVTRSKIARLGQPSGLVAFSRDGTAYHHRRVVDSWQGKSTVLVY